MDNVDDKLEQILAMRDHFEARNAAGLVELLSDRGDLRGVSALADHLGDRVLWCA